jgi:hypothetical protein
MRFRIQKGENPPKKEEKLSLKTSKVKRIAFLSSNILGKELGLKTFNVRKIR